MDYTLRQLKIFLKITEMGSITKASEELFLTQPAVSIQLKKFQDQFDIPLTEIIGRKLFVTDFGKEVAIAAENILNEVEAINYKTNSFRNLLSGKLKISVVSTGKYVMPYFLTDFLAKNKGVELSMDVTNKALVVKSLDENHVDFSLVSVLPDSIDVQSTELISNQLYLVGSPELIAQYEPKNPQFFEESPIIFRERGSATRNAMERFMKERKLYTRKKIELTSNEAVKQAVKAGLGFSIMPLIGLKNEIQNDEINIIPHPELPIVTKWNLVWLSNKQLSPIADAFLNFIKKHKHEIAHKQFEWYEKY